MRASRRLFLVLFPLALLVACASLFFARRVEVQTSLYDLIGGAGRTIPPAVREISSGLVPIIVSAEEAGRARKAADALFLRLTRAEEDGLCVTSLCSTVRYRQMDDIFSRGLSFYQSHRAGLAAPDVAEKLRTPEGRKSVARAALRRYYSSPLPPLFRAEDDPFCLLDGFVTSLPKSFSGWLPRDGVLTAEREGWTHLLMVLTLTPDLQADMERLADFKRRLDRAISQIAADAPECRIEACGAPLHTALAATRCRREIGALSWFSLLFIASLAIWVFRGVRWIPLLALSLGSSVLAGFSLLWALFGGVHLMAIVMGTTVLGLVIDYSFHWLLHPAEHRRETMRNLLVSFVTTEISLVPLMLSSIPVLRQVAVFLGGGLAAALVYVLGAYPSLPVAQSSRRAGRGGAIFVSLAIAGLSLWGWRSVRFGTEMSALYAPPVELQSSERLFAELSGTSQSQGMLVAEGGGLEALLEKEAVASSDLSAPCLSRFLPPRRRRESVAADVRKLYDEHAEGQARGLGVQLAPAPSVIGAWRLDEIPGELADAFVRKGLSDAGEEEGLLLVAPSVSRPRAALPEGVSFCNPREVVSDVLSLWTRETAVRLVVALGLMFAALAFCFRFRAVRVFAPSLFALAAVAGILGALETRISLFHLLAGFLLAGMSVDYTIFIFSGKSLRPVICSLLTSMAGFGALVFVSFPVVKAFGFVLGLGLPISFLSALALAPASAPNGVERAASPLGLEILFFAYRIVGLRGLRFLASAVGYCVWLSSPAVRRAAGSLRKTVAFTQSLSDKLVVMANGQDLPQVRFDGSPDAEEFFSNVKGGRGVFVLSSHCGTIEVLAAAGECPATFHAWMDFDRTSVFNRFYERHARRDKVVIHPISEIGMETSFWALDALEGGDCLVMAGDRGRGAFRFAKAMASPVYFVACLRDGAGYVARVRRLPDDVRGMERGYSDALSEVVAAYPDQWFTWRQV